MQVRAKLKAAARFLMRALVRLRLLWIFPRDPGVIENYSGANTRDKKRLCVFASFSLAGRVADYVFYNLSELQNAGFDIVFVTTSRQLHPEDLAKLRHICLRTLRRENIGYDFGSWKAGLFYSGINYREFDQVLLTNDSYYGPLFPWQQVLAQAHSDLYGITDSYGIAYHLMSYFVLYNKPVLHSADFERNWQSVRMVPTLLKTLIIYAYEVGMSQKFQKAGFSIAAYCPERRLFEKMPQHSHLFNKTIIVHSFWRELIEQLHCPILKVDTFWRVLRGDNSWRQVVKKTGFPLKLIENPWIKNEINTSQTH